MLIQVARQSIIIMLSTAVATSLLQKQLWEFTINGLRWKWPHQRYNTSSDEIVQATYSPIDEQLLSQSVDSLAATADSPFFVSIHTYLLLHGIDLRENPSQFLFSNLVSIDWRVLLRLQDETESCSIIDYPSFGLVSMLHDEITLNENLDLQFDNHDSVNLFQGTSTEESVDEINFKNFLLDHLYVPPNSPQKYRDNGYCSELSYKHGVVVPPMVDSIHFLQRLKTGIVHEGCNLSRASAFLSVALAQLESAYKIDSPPTERIDKYIRTEISTLLKHAQNSVSACGNDGNWLVITKWPIAKLLHAISMYIACPTDSKVLEELPVDVGLKQSFQADIGIGVLDLRNHFEDIGNGYFATPAPDGFIQVANQHCEHSSVFLNGGPLQRGPIQKEIEQEPFWSLTWEFGYARLLLYLTSDIIDADHEIAYSYVKNEDACIPTKDQPFGEGMHSRQKVFVDVDNTVAHSQLRINRNTVLTSEGYRIHPNAWQVTEILSDPLLAGEESIQALSVLQKSGYCIQFLTARPFDYALQITVQWLKSNGLPFSSVIVVNKAQQKPFWLEEEMKNLGTGSILLIDDLRRRYHHPDGPDFYHDVIADLDEKKIDFRIIDPEPDKAKTFWSTLPDRILTGPL